MMASDPHPHRVVSEVTIQNWVGVITGPVGTCIVKPLRTRKSLLMIIFRNFLESLYLLEPIFIQYAVRAHVGI